MAATVYSASSSTSPAWLSPYITGGTTGTKAFDLVSAALSRAQEQSLKDQQEKQTKTAEQAGGTTGLTVLGGSETDSTASGSSAVTAAKDEIAKIKSKAKADAAASASSGSELQSAEVKAEITRLTLRDQEVRAHEQAHRSVGGQFAGAPTYDYQRGPDGKNYAVGGEVSIDFSSVRGDPRATIAKMEQVRRAATAPDQPSAQDLRVAAEADQAIAAARAEMARQQVAGTGSVNDGTNAAASAATGQENASQTGNRQAAASRTQSASQAGQQTLPSLFASLRAITAYGNAATLGRPANAFAGLTI